MEGSTQTRRELEKEITLTNHKQIGQIQITDGNWTNNLFLTNGR